MSKFVFNVERLTDDIAQIVQEAAEDGKRIMREKIETSGLGVEWSRADKYGRTSSSPGRVASGKMRDAIDSEYKRDGDSAEARIGWLNEFEDYFGYQEGGFYHVNANRAIRGMNIMEETADELLEDIERKLNGVFRGF